LPDKVGNLAMDEYARLEIVRARINRRHHENTQTHRAASADCKDEKAKANLTDSLDATAAPWFEKVSGGSASLLLKRAERRVTAFRNGPR
jgi:hypothetical protein